MRQRVATGLVLVAALLSPRETPAGPEFKATEVVPGLYMLEGVDGFTGGNIGLLTGDDGTILIDDGLPPLVPKLIAAVASVTDDDVDFLINTHVHGDHVGGNAAFGEAGAVIVTHDNIRQRLVRDGMSVGSGSVPAPADALPVVTFSDAVTFHLNGHEAYVFHVANAHTDGDAVIHFRDIDVIHSGDILFNGLFPFIDLDTGGSVEGYIAAQERVLAMAGPETRIIPGHGPLCGRDELAAALDMLKDARERVKALVEAGHSEEEILARNPLADYHDGWNWGFITTERMTRTLIRSLTEGGAE